MSTHQLHHVAARAIGAPVALEPFKLDAILAALGSRVGIAAEYPQLPDSQDRPERDAPAGIAVVPVVGTLVARGFGGVDALSGLTSYASLAAQLDEACSDPAVDGILLDVDSPGGEVQGMLELAERVRACGKRKPIFASINHNAFSAAYAVASAAERVFVSRNGGAGSIGVVAVHRDQSQADRADGVAYSYVHAGKHKVDGNPHEPLAEPARAALQARVDAVYAQFLETVAKDGRVTEEQARETEAATYYGADAVAAGLADELGDFEAAAAALAERVFERRPTQAERSSSGSIYARSQTMAEQNDQPAVEASGQKTYGERVSALEGAVAALQGENAGLRAQLAAAQELVETQKRAESDRKAAEFAAFVDGVKVKACEAGSPISAERLEEIQSLYAAGQEGAARSVASMALERAEALGGGSAASATPKTVDLAPASAGATFDADDFRRRWNLSQN